MFSYVFCKKTFAQAQSNEKKRSKMIEAICMNEMSCRFRQISCKLNGKEKRPTSTPCFAKKVCNFRGEEEKKNRIYAQISSFCTKKKKSGI